MGWVLFGRGNISFARLDRFFENIHAEKPTAVIARRYAVSFIIDEVYLESIRQHFLVVSATKMFCRLPERLRGGPFVRSLDV